MTTTLNTTSSALNTVLNEATKQYQTKIIQFEKSLSFGNRRLVMKTLSKHYHTANSFDKVTAKKNLQNQPNLREFKHSKIRDPNFGIELLRLNVLLVFLLILTNLLWFAILL